MPSEDTLGTALVAVVALAGGIFVGYSDSHSDDVPVTLAQRFGLSFLLGFLRPRRPWLWAVLVGGWTPVLDTALPLLGLAPQEPALAHSLLPFWRF